MGYYIVAKESPDQARRFVRTFNGIGSVSFSPKPMVSVSSGGKYSGNRPLEVCKSIVDLMREAAAAAKAPAFWASVVVEDYEGSCHYPRVEDQPKAALV